MIDKLMVAIACYYITVKKYSSYYKIYEEIILVAYLAISYLAFLRM